MSRRDWSRPKYRMQGRIAEPLNGNVPEEFRPARKPNRPKAELREEAKRAAQEFAARRPSYQQPLTRVNILPPLSAKPP